MKRDSAQFVSSAANVDSSSETNSATSIGPSPELCAAKRKHSRAYALLGLAILFEVCSTTCLKLSAGCTVLLPTLGVFCFYSVCFILIIYVLKYLPLGLVYGIWGGVGSILTTVIGIMLFDDPFTVVTAIGILTIIGGIALLNYAQTKHDA